MNIINIGYNNDNVKPPNEKNFADVVRGANKTFAELSKQINVMQDEMNKMPSEIINDILKYLDLSEQIQDFKEQIDNVLSGIGPQVDQIEGDIVNFIDQGRPYTAWFLYLPAGLMAVICVVFFLCLVFFIAEAFFRRLFSLTGKGPSDRKT